MVVKCSCVAAIGSLYIIQRLYAHQAMLTGRVVDSVTQIGNQCLICFFASFSITGQTCFEKNSTIASIIYDLSSLCYAF